jgi:chromate transporter
VAHLGFFRTEIVDRRRWLTDAQYADLVALGQFLPGPASSQVGMGIGLVRGGIPGSLRAWLGFTVPSATLMIAAGLAVGGGVALPDGMLAGLKVAAVAVVAHAVLMMASTLARGWLRALLAVGTGVAVLAVPTLWMPTLALVLCGLVGVLVIRDIGARDPGDPDDVVVPVVPRWVASASLVAFTALLVGLPVVARSWPGEWATLLAGFYRAGALVFGGGHVVLPMLEEVVVGSGAVSQADFVAGYGLANAVPGPLFTFAGYLGASAGGVLLGMACVVAIFLPGYLLVVGVLGHWHAVAGNTRVRRALAGVNAAVVGLLGAALYDPVITAGITGWRTAVLAALALLALLRIRAAPHLVVLACALVGWLLLG